LYSVKRPCALVFETEPMDAPRAAARARQIDARALRLDATAPHALVSTEHDRAVVGNNILIVNSALRLISK
jgi:hypothetical protein